MRVIDHRTVYQEPGVFAGWPANHGAWQWGDEMLVGFMRGPYTRKMRTHQIDEPFEKMLARSLDGGRTWAVEKPNVDFEAARTEPPPEFRFSDTIIRACGVYDHGGEHCDPSGGFYTSKDRGRTWDGPFAFSGLEREFGGEYECTARTATVGHLGAVFLTRRIAGRFGTDAAFVAAHNGSHFVNLGFICNDGRRAAMPAVANVDGRYVAVLRRHDFSTQRYWLETFATNRSLRYWQSCGEVAETSNRNGNPPALIEVGGKLVCAFGDRDAGAICICVSNDEGDSWGPPTPIRTKGKSDIGYPVLFKRADGALVCVYYWASGTGDQQHIEATEFSL